MSKYREIKGMIHSEKGESHKDSYKDNHKDNKKSVGGKKKQKPKKT